ncbi:MAG: DUF308 domain-containing protein [Patescibacteria group bacterium]
MQNSNLKWVMVIRGILFSAFGLIALFYPGLTLLGLVYFLGIVAIFNGFLAFFQFFLNKNGTHLATGIIEIIIGILVMLYPDISAEIFTWLLTLWLLIAGLSLFVSGVTLPKNFGSQIYSIIGGILMTVLAFFLIAQPIWMKTFDILLLIGILSLLSGIVVIILGISIHQKLKN